MSEEDRSLRAIRWITAPPAEALGNPKVRGLGLTTAMDVADESHVSLALALRDEVFQSAFRHGLLLLGCGESAV